MASLTQNVLKVRTAGSLEMSNRSASAAFLASAWCLPAAVLAGYLTDKAGYWRGLGAHAMVLGSPALVLLARVVLWGWALAFLLSEASLPVLCAAAVIVDLALLRFTVPSLPIDAGFLALEILTVVLCLIPAQLFARWTREQKHLAARNVLHFLFHAGLLLGVWPLLIVQCLGGDWTAWASRSSMLNKLYLQLLFIPGVLLLTGMQEFYQSGRGTPMPADAPQRLVTTGVYAYVANPMQIGKFGVLAGWGLFWRNPWIIAASFAGLFYSLSLARWREDRDMRKRFGAAWLLYRQNVRRWLPRWRPWVPPREIRSVDDSAFPVHATLYLDFRCGTCSQLVRWFLAQRPAGLRIRALEDHPTRMLSRITYTAGRGHSEEEGIAAIARALDHIHVGWAFCGWMLRLPLVREVSQLIADAVSVSPAPACAMRKTAHNKPFDRPEHLCKPANASVFLEAKAK